MKVELSERQIRYVMSKIEVDVLAGNPLADAVERELDLCLMDEEQRAAEKRAEAVRKYEEWKRAEALAYLASRR